MQTNNIAIIPARGGSKGIPKKNTKIIAKKPLIQWSIEHALKSECISRVIVSTDCNEIADIAKKNNAEVPFIRPDPIASDEASTESVINHCLKWLKDNESYIPDNIILLQPTSPVRLINSIDNDFKIFKKNKADSLLSASEFTHFLWKNLKDPQPLYDFNNRPRRQDIDLSNVKLKENGSIYISSYENFKNNKNRLGGSVEIYVMNEFESFEIDTELDFLIVESILNWSNKIVNK